MPQHYWVDWERFEESAYFNGLLRADITVTLHPGYPASFHDEHQVECSIVNQSSCLGMILGIQMPTSFLIPVKEEILNW